MLTVTRMLEALDNIDDEIYWSLGGGMLDADCRALLLRCPLDALVVGWKISDDWKRVNAAVIQEGEAQRTVER